MKKIISSILIVSLLFILSACNSSKTTVCNNCGGKLKENAKFCSECGTELTVQNNTPETSESTDYSDFGFQNNHNMNQWIEIENYDFSDSQNAYIETTSPMVVIFENNYLQKRYFSTHPTEIDETKLSSGDGTVGELYGEPKKYEVSANDVLNFVSGGTLVIEDVKLERGIPIISTDEFHYELVIPMYFIDFERGVEITDYVVNNGTYIRYYIKPEYIK